MKKLRYLSILTFWLVSFLSMAQIISVQAKIDSTSLLIGQQTQIHFELVQSKSSTVQYPLFTDSIVSGVELVERSKLDTISLENGDLMIKSSITITSFDSAEYQIPAFSFIQGTDTVRTNPLTLMVLPVQVDTANARLYAIKPIYDAKINWAKVLTITGISILALALTVFLFIYLRKKLKKTEEEPEEEIVIVNPYEHAKTELDRIRNEKLWQQGRLKEFYTEISEVLREYIELRFKVPALEMTSDEVLQRIKLDTDLDKDNIASLKQVLKLSDLVKFAKWSPELSENDLSLDNAFSFVEKTKPAEEIVAEPKEEAESTVENETNIDKD